MKNKIYILFSLIFMFISIPPVYADDGIAYCPTTLEIRNLDLIKAYPILNNWWFVDASRFLSGGAAWKAFFSIGFDTQKDPAEALEAAKLELLQTRLLPGLGYSSQGITFCLYLNTSKDKNFVVAVSPAFFVDDVKNKFKQTL